MPGQNKYNMAIKITLFLCCIFEKAKGKNKTKKKVNLEKIYGHEYLKYLKFTNAQKYEIWNCKIKALLQ